MTSEQSYSELSWEEVCQMIGQSSSPDPELQKLTELARQQAVEVFSKSPLHHARAEKDPDYWKTLGPMGMWPKEGRMKTSKASLADSA